LTSKKELDAFIKNKAEEIYELYPRKADRPNSIKSIIRLLNNPPSEMICGAGGLLLAVKNYKAIVEAEGTKPKYILQSNNFFGEAERWREYLTTTTPEPGDPFARNFT